jgi:GH25 family lysozyme M1 (1,4-beta-N-acetylmuramidase)
MGLKAIDIASWQAGIVPSRTDADIVIVKATGGTWYENPFFEQWADDVLASGKMLGIYHCAVESVRWKTAHEEARYFLDHVAKYEGRFVPILDWESDAMELPQEWALEWMDLVAQETGATPFFYAYASHLNSKSYDKVAAKYPLWMASYLNRYIGAGWVDAPVNNWELGSWDRMLMYQYTSTGRIKGYDNDLDLSVYYNVASAWQAMCGTPAQVPSGKLTYPQAMVEVAWHIILHDAHGYSQPNRAGDGTVEDLTLSDGTLVRVHGGDYDCSETMRMVIAAVGLVPWDYWTSYMWTGNEDEILTMYGFVRVDKNQPRPGDILWREGHTEIYLGDGLCGGARHGDAPGGLTGAQGDQDGTEITYSKYYPGNWTRCYRCTLKRDGEGEAIGEEGDEMTMLIHPKDMNRVYYWTGSMDDVPYHVSGPEKTALEHAYALVHPGKKLPFVVMEQADFDAIMAGAKARKAWIEQGVAQATSAKIWED